MFELPRNQLAFLSIVMMLKTWLKLIEVKVLIHNLILEAKADRWSALAPAPLFHWVILDSWQKVVVSKQS